jgi:hypothetical protein
MEYKAAFIIHSVYDGKQQTGKQQRARKMASIKEGEKEAGMEGMQNFLLSHSFSHIHLCDVSAHERTCMRFLSVLWWI